MNGGTTQEPGSLSGNAAVEGTAVVENIGLQAVEAIQEMLPQAGGISTGLIGAILENSPQTISGDAIPKGPGSTAIAAQDNPETSTETYIETLSTGSIPASLEQLNANFTAYAGWRQEAEEINNALQGISISLTAFLIGVILARIAWRKF